jgi:hypothetical protein
MKIAFDINTTEQLNVRLYSLIWKYMMAAQAWNKLSLVPQHGAAVFYSFCVVRVDRMKNIQKKSCDMVRWCFKIISVIVKDGFCRYVKGY